MKRPLLLLCLMLMITLLLPLRVTAQEESAKDISGTGLVTESSGIPSVPSIFDRKRSDGWKTDENATIKG